MKRPRVLALLALAVATTGLVAPAMAEEPQPRQKVCVKQPMVLPNGFCIVVDDPTLPQ